MGKPTSLERRKAVDDATGDTLRAHYWPFQGTTNDGYFLTPTGAGMWEKNHWVVTQKSSASCVTEAKKTGKVIPESFAIDADIETHNETHQTKRFSGSYRVTNKMTDGTTTTEQKTFQYP